MAVANGIPGGEGEATLRKVIADLRGETVMMRGMIAFLAAQIVRLSPDPAAAEASIGGHFLAFAQATGAGMTASGMGNPAELTLVAERMTEWLEHYARQVREVAR